MFVRQADGDFDLHEVVLGAGALGKVQVLSGLLRRRTGRRRRRVYDEERHLEEHVRRGLLVLFVLRGNFRAGVVVATIIPLALVFAITVMHAAGLSGNLMSLGALDFGLIVDGAVIIVENAVRRLSEAQRSKARELTSDERLEVVEDATMEVRSASVFGELIIAIVYVPILALVGIEGKMFRPMAITVLLALAGAFVLSLTLVPVLTSYVVRAQTGEHETWPLRLARKGFVPALATALRHRTMTITVGVIALAAAVAVFTRIGAEFVPQLVVQLSPRSRRPRACRGDSTFRRASLAPRSHDGARCRARLLTNGALDRSRE